MNCVIEESGVVSEFLFFILWLDVGPTVRIQVLMQKGKTASWFPNETKMKAKNVVLFLTHLRDEYGPH